MVSQTISIELFFVHVTTHTCASLSIMDIPGNIVLIITHQNLSLVLVEKRLIHKRQYDRVKLQALGCPGSQCSS